MGRRGYFFTLDYHAGDVASRLRALGVDPAAVGDGFVLDTSDDICAEHVVAHLRAAPRGAVAVIDYLQLLDQRRRHPALGDQVDALRDFARASGTIVVALAQIDRSFELGAKPLPELADVRLPNPLDLTLFSKACFLHEGEISMEAVV